jgi:hypothetical protein
MGGELEEGRVRDDEEGKGKGSTSYARLGMRVVGGPPRDLT